VYANVVNTSEIQMLERVLAFTETRHQILANNIANIDTPGFKVKDLDLNRFQQDLLEATRSREAPSSGEDPFRRAKVDFDQYLLFHDGNNRSIEKQMTAITKNSILHNVATEILRTRYQLLERAISLKF